MYCRRSRPGNSRHPQSIRNSSSDSYSNFRGERFQDKDAECTGQVARPLGINARDESVQRLAVPRCDGFYLIPERVL